MENIILVLLFYFIGTMLSSRGKKKRTPPPGLPEQIPGQGAPEKESERRIAFEIPHLEGAPPLPSKTSSGEGEGEEDAFLPETTWEPEFREEWKDAVEEPQNVLEGNGAKHVPQEQPDGEHSPIRFTPQNALQAIAMAEILGRPKAYRNMR